jgi:hypothetical protein
MAGGVWWAGGGSSWRPSAYVVRRTCMNGEEGWRGGQGEGWRMEGVGGPWRSSRLSAHRVRHAVQGWGAWKEGGFPFLPSKGRWGGVTGTGGVGRLAVQVRPSALI